jgi:hypothetical protein
MHLKNKNISGIRGKKMSFVNGIGPAMHLHLMEQNKLKGWGFGFGAKSKKGKTMLLHISVQRTQSQLTYMKWLLLTYENCVDRVVLKW